MMSALRILALFAGSLTVLIVTVKAVTEFWEVKPK